MNRGRAGPFQTRAPGPNETRGRTSKALMVKKYLGWCPGGNDSGLRNENVGGQWFPGTGSSVRWGSVGGKIRGGVGRSPRPPVSNRPVFQCGRRAPPVSGSSGPPRTPTLPSGDPNAAEKPGQGFQRDQKTTNATEKRLVGFQPAPGPGRKKRKTRDLRQSMGRRWAPHHTTHDPRGGGGINPPGGGGPGPGNGCQVPPGQGGSRFLTREGPRGPAAGRGPDQKPIRGLFQQSPPRSGAVGSRKAPFFFFKGVGGAAGSGNRYWGLPARRAVFCRTGGIGGAKAIFFGLCAERCGAKKPVSGPAGAGPVRGR